MTALTPHECAFCREKADSKEHWPPKWMQGVLDFADSRNHAVSIGPSEQLTGFFHQKGARAKTLSNFCERCNNVWMGRIIDKSKEVIMSLNKNPRKLISEAEKLHLSKYAILQTMIVEFADYNTIATPQEERENFYKDIPLQGNWSVFMGFREKFNPISGFKHVAWNVPHRLREISSNKDFIYDPPLFENQATMFHIGGLCLITSSSKRKLDKEYLKSLKKWPIERIYPDVGGVTWFNRGMNDDDMTQMFRSFIPETYEIRSDLKANLRQQRRSGRRRTIQELLEG